MFCKPMRRMSSPLNDCTGIVEKTLAVRLLLAVTTTSSIVCVRSVSCAATHVIQKRATIPAASLLTIIIALCLLSYPIPRGLEKFSIGRSSDFCQAGMSSRTLRVSDIVVFQPYKGNLQQRDCQRFSLCSLLITWCEPNAGAKIIHFFISAKKKRIFLQIY